MKSYIISSVLLAMTVFFAGCSCCAQEMKKEKANHPKPEAVLIIDDVAYYDGCSGCPCAQEAVCVCAEKADCPCCRKHLKKCPKDMQEKCKAMKKELCKKKAAEKCADAPQTNKTQSGN